MDVSHVLAKLFGIYFLIVGLFLVLKKRELRSVTQNLAQNPGLVVTNGALSLLLGLLILLIHPVWELNWKGFITFVCGALAIVVGIIRMFFFGRLGAFAERAVSGNRPIYFGILLILVGLWLTYMGFTAPITKARISYFDLFFGAST